MPDGMTALHYASASGSAACAATLVAGGAALDASGARTPPPLHLACRSGHTETVRVLIAAAKRGAELTAEDGTTAAHVAADVGEAECLAMLLDAGARPDAVRQDGGTPLHYACMAGHSECTSLLLSAGANPNVKRSDQVTACHLAAQAGSEECLRLLCAARCDVNSAIANARQRTHGVLPTFG